MLYLFSYASFGRLAEPLLFKITIIEGGHAQQDSLCHGYWLLIFYSDFIY